MVFTLSVVTATVGLHIVADLPALQAGSSNMTLLGMIQHDS